MVDPCKYHHVGYLKLAKHAVDLTIYKAPGKLSLANPYSSRGAKTNI